MPFKDPERLRAYDRERKRKWYDNLTGVEYNELRLKRRRTMALARMAQRNNKEELDG